MPSTQYESRRLYYLHIFKTNPGSGWTDPSILTFPLSSSSAHKFGSRSRNNRYSRDAPKGHNRDGLTSLHRLPSDQLSFLQQYVQKLNTEVEENKTKMVQDWKTSTQQEEKERSERVIKEHEVKMKLLDSKRQYLKERAQSNKTDKQKQGREETKRYGGGGGGGGDVRYNNSDSDSTTRDYSYVPRGREFRLPAHPELHIRPTRRQGHYNAPNSDVGPSPALFETLWTIDHVELSFTPEIVSYSAARAESQGREFLGVTTLVENSNDNNYRQETKNHVVLTMLTNQIAPESYSSFAVVLSRCAGVELPNDLYTPHRRENSRARSYVSDSSISATEEDFSAEEITISRYPLPVRMPPAVKPNDELSATSSNEAETAREENIETESRTGEEGDDCDEGVVYIKDLKKPE